MAWIREHWLMAAIGTLGLLLVTIGVDARPQATTAPATPTAVRTQTVAPIAVADLPQENGQPVLPAVQDEPRVLTFTLALEPTPLIEEADSIYRPGAVHRLVIPRISLDSEVAQVGIVNEGGNLTYETANFVVGQYRGVNPSEGSNVVLAGHVNTRNGLGGQVFVNLHKLELGDDIAIYTDNRTVRYQVSEIRFVSATAVEVMDTTPGERLTLITCRSCNIDCQRLVVIALPIEDEEAGISNDV